MRPKIITVGAKTKTKTNALKKLLTGSKNGRTPDETWFVYLLRCADGSLYTGITNDVPRRLEQHNAGTASRYTRSRLPVALVYQEAQASRSLALKRELAIKGLSRREKEAMILATGLTTRRVKSKLNTALPLNQRENLMAKIPSRKFSTAKKKIPSTKFPTAKRKLSSGKLAKQSAKIPSRKFAKAKKATKQGVNKPAPLGHSSDEQARQKAVTILKSRTDALKAGGGE